MSSTLVLQRPLLPKQKRVVLFIDAANLYYAMQALSIRIDYRKLKAYLTDAYFLTDAWYYTGIDSTNPEQLRFLSSLSRIGYKVISDELVKRIDGSVKANLDVKIAIDMGDYINSYDAAVLITGDGDLKWVVEKVQNQGKWVEVVGLSSMTSYVLRNMADRFIDLADIQSKICL